MSGRPNVSRVCFESYDPDLFMNLECEEFQGIEQDKGYQYIERPPICILTDEDKKISIIQKFNFGVFVSGNRNNYILGV